MTAELILTAGSSHMPTTKIINGNFISFDIIGECDALFPGIPFGTSGTIAALTLEET